MKTIHRSILIGVMLLLQFAGLSYAESGSKAQLDVKMVCMMNDQFMGTPQIPVQVGDKTYYGCCQGCVTGLKQDRSLRYAIDPSSGNEVDKASAFIVKKSDGSTDVNYFESFDSFLEYSN